MPKSRWYESALASTSLAVTATWWNPLSAGRESVVVMAHLAGSAAHTVSWVTPRLGDPDRSDAAAVAPGATLRHGCGALRPLIPTGSVPGSRSGAATHHPRRRGTRRPVSAPGSTQPVVRSSPVGPARTRPAAGAARRRRGGRRRRGRSGTHSRRPGGVERWSLPRDPGVGVGRRQPEQQHHAAQEPEAGQPPRASGPAPAITAAPVHRGSRRTPRPAGACGSCRRPAGEGAAGRAPR